MKSSLLAALFLLTGCAHSYYYAPEIKGDAARQGRQGGIVYAIPPTGAALLALRVRAIGVHKVKGTQMLGVRMSFARSAKNGTGDREFLRPEEQAVRIGDGSEIHAAYVHTKARSQSVIELTGRESEVVELLYPLRDNEKGAADLERYSFRWVVHFGAEKTESQVVQFDRYDSAPQQAGSMFPEDPDYPYDRSPIVSPNNWTEISDPADWWPIAPWRPWW